MDEILAKLEAESWIETDWDNRVVSMKDAIRVLRNHHPTPCPQQNEAMVERVAVALANAQRHRAGLHSLSIEDLKHPSFSWDNAIHDAKAAIAALQPAPKESDDE